MESELAIKGSEVEPVANTHELVTYNDLQPEPKFLTLGTGGKCLMKTIGNPIILKILSKQPSNKQPFLLPCLILKNEGCKKLDFTNYLIDKDILAQILYEVFYKNDIPQKGIPLVISLKNNLINRMESKGIYVLDSNNDQFVYIFGQEDHKEFFEKLAKIKADAKINTSLAVAYLTSNEDQPTSSQTYLDKIDRLIDLHGSVSGKRMILDANKSITFPLMNKEFKLHSFYWIENKEEVGEVNEF